MEKVTCRPSSPLQQIQGRELNTLRGNRQTPNVGQCTCDTLEKRGALGSGCSGLKTKGTKRQKVMCEI